MNKFIWQDQNGSVEMTVEGSPTLDELLEVYTRFLQAQGFEKPTPFSRLDFVDDEGWRGQ